MSIAELSPESRPEPVSGVVLKAAFETYFEAVTVASVDPSKPCLHEAKMAAHQIATSNGPFAETLLYSSQAFEEYYLERYRTPEEPLAPGVAIFNSANLRAERAANVLRHPIQAYSFSGLAITDGRCMVRAAEAFGERRIWVDSIITEGREAVLQELDRHDKMYRWNYSYVTQLGESALSSLTPPEPKKMTRGQKRALQAAGADLTQILPNFVARPDTDE